VNGSWCQVTDIATAAHLLRKILESPEPIICAGKPEDWTVCGFPFLNVLDYIKQNEETCDCAYGEVDGHTRAAHLNDSCGGWTFDPPCGGCYQCLAMQAAYYNREDTADG